jgi:hypothetical protein
MEERNKLNDSYSWVEKKYSDSRFHYMALQVYFAGDDE